MEDSAATNRGTMRFSDRVADYVKYRPGYPKEIIAHLESSANLNSATVIADIGVGTGISSEHFVALGNTVYGVEPNADMRAAAESYYSNDSNFIAIDGSAECTTLPNNSVDLIIAGQAFHWFNQEKAREEWKRILKSNGKAVLVWNDRLVNTPFLKAYEDFLFEFATDYNKVNHRRIDLEVVQDFFAPNTVELATFPNAQLFDYKGLHGRVLSSSYIPNSDAPIYPKLAAALHALHDFHQVDGMVSFDYQTLVYSANL